MKKILVIGTSGSGKSTLAKQISELIEIQFFPSDDFYWEENWITSSSKKVHEKVSDVLSHEEWILDGNFDDEREFVWKQADCIIWLDYPLSTILKQVATRNFRWLLTGQTTWSGNKMNFRRVISGIRHAVKSYSVKKRNYPAWLAELPDVKIYRFCTTQETEIWLQGLH